MGCGNVENHLTAHYHLLFKHFFFFIVWAFRHGGGHIFHYFPISENKKTNYQPLICIPTFSHARMIITQTTAVNAKANAIFHLFCAIANTNVANRSILATNNRAARKGATYRSSINSFPVSKHNQLSARKPSVTNTLTTGATHQYLSIVFDISFIFRCFRSRHFSITKLTHTSSTHQLPSPYLLSFIWLKTTNTLSV